MKVALFVCPQISTWFANARRRLKKDSRRLSGDGDAEDGLGDDSDKDAESDTISVDGPLPGDKELGKLKFIVSSFW